MNVLLRTEKMLSLNTATGYGVTKMAHVTLSSLLFTSMRAVHQLWHLAIWGSHAAQS